MRSKSWDEFASADAPEMDLVITVCGNAADEVCPIWPGAPVTTHWGTEDPAAASQDTIQQAFQSAFEILDARAQAFLSLELEDFNSQNARDELSRIGQLMPG